MLLWTGLPERFSINPPISFTSTPKKSELLDRLILPAGFSISIYAEGLQGVRMLAITKRGDLIASLPDKGELILLSTDANNDGRADRQSTLLRQLNRPHGLDLHQGGLYIAETDAISRIQFDAEKGNIVGQRETIVANDFPGSGGHWTRTVRVGPDDMLYLSIGSSCNVCEEKHPKRAAILRYAIDGSNGEIFASGLRNSVGFDWQPNSGLLFATDNGRDYLGDDYPPDELNQIKQAQHYGWPYASGNRIADPKFGPQHSAEILRSQIPVHNFPAHSAPLGMRFLNHKNLPEHYIGSALVALHGSWNRSTKQGYKVVSLHFDEHGKITEKDFISGFEIDEHVVGRPVDIVEADNGSIFISDDYSGRIYRVWYNKN